MGISVHIINYTNDGNIKLRTIYGDSAGTCPFWGAFFTARFEVATTAGEPGFARVGVSMAMFSLSSPAFEDGASIPERYGYTEANVNPPLEFEAMPAETASLAIVIDDPDAREPAGKIWDHWVVWNVPPDVTTLSEDYDARTAGEGRNDFGERGYGGPNPPDGRHTYRFIAYALDTTLDIPAGSTKVELEAAIEGHVLAQDTLEGTYAP